MLSVEAISHQLGIAPTVVEQMLHTLVSRGKLTQVDPASCPVEACLFHKVYQQAARDPAGVFAPGREGVGP